MDKLEVKTDCGVITVEEYDDGCANGVHIMFNGAIVAAVDCYKLGRELPDGVCYNEDLFDNERDLDEQIADKLSDDYGYCVLSFSIKKTPACILVNNIDWDLDDPTGEPEARLLVYGGDNEDCDEPKDIIPLN